MSTAPVPMSHPATAVKNSDGTYTVRIQHTTGGSVTEVDFKNVYFAETLANGYAAMLNGQAVVSAVVAKAALDAKPAIADAQADLTRLVTAAEGEAKNILDAAKLEASELKTEAGVLYNQTKAQAESLLDAAKKHLEEVKIEAETLLTEAKTEAAKLLHAAATKIEPTPAPEPVTPAAKPPVVEDEN